MAQPLLTKPREEKAQNQIARRDSLPDATKQSRNLDTIFKLHHTLGNQHLARLIQTNRLRPDGKIVGMRGSPVGGTVNRTANRQHAREANQRENCTSDALDPAEPTLIERGSSLSGGPGRATQIASQMPAGNALSRLCAAASSQAATDDKRDLKEEDDQRPVSPPGRLHSTTAGDPTISRRADGHAPKSGGPAQPTASQPGRTSTVAMPLVGASVGPPQASAPALRADAAPVSTTTPSPTAATGLARSSLSGLVTSLSSMSVATAPTMLNAAGPAVSALGDQLTDKARARSLGTTAPTGLPVGPAPIMPLNPGIPEADDPRPASDADSPGAIGAAEQAGEHQLESGKHAAEPADGDMCVLTLAPTDAPAPIPPLQLEAALPVRGPAPMSAISDQHVSEVLESAYGGWQRAATDGELAKGRDLLNKHDEDVAAQHIDTAGQLRAQNDRESLAQVVVREEARAGIEQDRTTMHVQTTEVIQDYRRSAAAEQAQTQSEIQQAKNDAQQAQAAESNASQPENQDSAWYERAWNAVKSGAQTIGGKIKDAVTKAYQFVKERMTRFFSKVRELVSAGIAKLREIGGHIYQGIRNKLQAALNKINEIARRIGAFAADLMRRLGGVISGLIKRAMSGLLAIVDRITGLWRKVLALAGKVKGYLVMLAKGAMKVVVELIEKTKAVLEKAKGAIQTLIDKAPAKLDEIYQKHIAPRIGGRPVSATVGAAPVASSAQPPSATAQGMTAQRQEAQPALEAAGPDTEETHAEALGRHFHARFEYFRAHWWDVVCDAALEILVPGVAVYRHLPPLWEALKDGWKALMAGQWSQAIDAGLTAGREAMSILSSFIAQASIAVFIVGSVLGTPVVGAAALESIGLATIAIDSAFQLATIDKSLNNLDRRDEDHERLETDYGRVADSSISLMVMLALVLLGAIASKAASSLVRRFPALGRAAEAFKGKVQRGLGLKGKSPAKVTSKLKPLDPLPAEALDLPIRKDLLPREQLAFDKWVADRRAAGVDVDKALKGKTPDQVRRMIKSQLDWVAEQEARHAHNAQWEGDMLDPKMTNGPKRVGSADVWTRWNEKPPAEIDEGIRLNGKTGERIDLFGDDYPGIDGTIGQPPRPLQLKAVPASEDIANIPRVAGKALTNARNSGFSRVEVSIEAPGRTVEQVRDAFARNPTKFTDSTGVTRVRVWCDDGMFEPTSFKPVIPPPRVEHGPENNKDKVPAGAGAD
ncbi:hypothetical protein [Paraburkholderia aromaticivorans]|uniref:hypothetical protein n=1 Tax=Paraburkholderia aromaticivorans TaxID=2026199 RepID=UPI0014560BD6|nr:hypothetical protein [Paraburkholderia aromaticivorans]